MGSEERLAGERSERKLVAEGKEPLGNDVGTEQEMDSQTKEGLQALQETKRKEESPDDCPLMHTAATRGAFCYCHIRNHTTSTKCALCTLLAEELEVRRDCALNGEMKGSFESFKNSHMTEGWAN